MSVRYCLMGRMILALHDVSFHDPDLLSIRLYLTEM